MGKGKDYYSDEEEEEEGDMEEGGVFDKRESLLMGKRSLRDRYGHSGGEGVGAEIRGMAVAMGNAAALLKLLR